MLDLFAPLELPFWNPAGIAPSPVATSTWVKVEALAAVAAAVATVAAVVVALFGQRWRDYRVRPNLSLHRAGPATVTYDLTTENQQPYWDTVVLEVRNARGRHTAHNVEVLLTVDLENRRLLDNQPLRWWWSNDVPGERSLSIPPGVPRKIAIMRMGQVEFRPGHMDEGKRHHTHLWAGVFSVWPLDEIPPYLSNACVPYGRLKLRLTVTAENVDARVYAATILTLRRPGSDEQFFSLTWEGLREVRPARWRCRRHSQAAGPPA